MTAQNKLPFSISATVVFAALTTALTVILFAPWTTHSVRTPSFRIQVTNNLTQIALAMHRYAEEHGKLLPPQAIYSKDGKPLLSWRVLLLPYVEQKKLFDQFHLDEAWDSPHNISLLQWMPPIYEHPRDTTANAQHLTCYRVFVGAGTAFEGRKGISLGDFADGTGNTLLVVEAAEAVPWTKPAEFAYAPESAMPKLGGRFQDRFCALLADGSILFVPQTVTEDRLRAAITRNGGEKVNLLDDH
jgi:hypothetical protein